MTKRHLASQTIVPWFRFRAATALVETVRQGYSPRDFRADVLAGILVGVVALPLSMALAIATGVPPQYGLYTAIVAGTVIAFFGGSRVQVSGPTAAFVVILVPIVTQHGLAGLAVATVMAGLIQIILALSRLGRLIQFVPHPVTIGFTAGIAVVIATLQMKDFFGLSIASMPDSYVERVATLASSLPSFRWPDLVVGAACLGILIGWDRVTKKVPAALVALTVCGVGAYVAHMAWGDGFVVETIRGRFGSEALPHGIPQKPPLFDLPWRFHRPGEAETGMTWGVLFLLCKELVPAAFAIAMLGSIESLLSAVVADGMSGHTHDPDSELFAQGLGNIAAPFFGGFAATGAIARTAANIRFGARSPVSAIVHAQFVLFSMLLLAPLLGHLPMAALAALLLRVAWNMSEARHFIHTIRVAPRSDVAVLLTCFGLTVIFDMVIAVSVGVVLAAMLFMRRMAEVANVRFMQEKHHAITEPLPPGVLVYEIAGPMFFGAAQRAMSAFRTIGNGVKVVILDMESVPVMDATGLVNLEGAIDRLGKTQITVILAGVQRQPHGVMERGELFEDRPHLLTCATMHEAVQIARRIVQGEQPTG